MAVLPQRWPWTVRLSVDLPIEVQKYLADTEINALGGQRHESVMLEPLGTTIAGVIACLFVISRLPADAARIGDVLVVTMIVFLGRLGFKAWEWNRDLIFITNKRILQVRGLVTRRVEMMPLSKLTDMSYIRTPVGSLLGYGTFRVESAGQDQALSTLSPIPDPDDSYRYVQNLLFGRATTDVRLVDITTEEKLDVRWSGRIKRNQNNSGDEIEQQSDDGWWKNT